MKSKKIICYILLVGFLHSCADYQKYNKKIVDERKYFSSNGFALIYDKKLFDDKIINKKINNEEIVILHNFLKSNTLLKITNPQNSKFVEVKVRKKSNYPKIFNIVISKKISLILELDEDNPYVEIVEKKKNKTFVAAETNIFDEEINVAEKAPVDVIQMDDLSSVSQNYANKLKKDKKFILVINDFYYEESANNLKNLLVKNEKISNLHVKKITVKQHRLLAGPFKNFNALKTTYISLNNLGFGDLNIDRN